MSLCSFYAKDFSKRLSSQKAEVCQNLQKLPFFVNNGQFPNIDLMILIQHFRESPTWAETILNNSFDKYADSSNKDQKI